MFKDKIDISIILSLDNFFKFDDVGMVEFHQKHYLSVGSLCICRIIKGIKILFECFNLLTFFICNFPDMSIGPTTYFPDDIKTC